MNLSLRSTIRRLELQKAELVRRIEAWPSEWLACKPSPSEWSALEVLDHLRKTELAVLHSCEKNLKSREYLVTPTERAKTVLLLTMMRLPIKLKVPEPVSFVLPDGVTCLEAELTLWSAQRLLLNSFLEALPTIDGSVGAIYHPATGWMNLRAALRFLSVHIRHHEFQLQRIKNARGGPGY